MSTQYTPGEGVDVLHVHHLAWHHTQQPVPGGEAQRELGDANLGLVLGLGLLLHLWAIQSCMWAGWSSRQGWSQGSRIIMNVVY